MIVHLELLQPQSLYYMTHEEYSATASYVYVYVDTYTYIYTYITEERQQHAAGADATGCYTMSRRLAESALLHRSLLQ